MKHRNLFFFFLLLVFDLSAPQRSPATTPYIVYGTKNWGASMNGPHTVGHGGGLNMVW
jgi:hypothetical protein